MFPHSAAQLLVIFQSVFFKVFSRLQRTLKLRACVPWLVTYLYSEDAIQWRHFMWIQQCMGRLGPKNLEKCTGAGFFVFLFYSLLTIKIPSITWVSAGGVVASKKDPFFTTKELLLQMIFIPFDHITMTNAFGLKDLQRETSMNIYIVHLLRLFLNALFGVVKDSCNTKICNKA